MHSSIHLYTFTNVIKAIFEIMKYNEFHRLIKRRGWVAVRQKGSHVIYEKEGVRYTVPNHGSKEFPEALRMRIVRDMGL